MTERSLQVTYRKGRAFAAYLHLSHPTGEKSAKTVASQDGLLVVDYGATGQRPAIAAAVKGHPNAGASFRSGFQVQSLRSRKPAPRVLPLE